MFGSLTHLVVQQQVPQLPAALRVVGGVVEAELLDQAPLAPAGPARVVVGPDDVHLHFARGVAAQPRSVLHEHDPRPVPRRGHGRAYSRHSPAGDEQSHVQVHQRHVRLGGGEPRRGVRGRGDDVENLVDVVRGANRRHRGAGAAGSAAHAPSAFTSTEYPLAAKAARKSRRRMGGSSAATGRIREP